MPQPISLAVRQLIEFVLRRGDLVATTFSAPSRAVAGTRGHQKVQKARPAHYEAEVAFAWDCEADSLSFQLRGRMDGVFRLPDGPIIDEIKTTTLPVTAIADDNELHWAQAKVYAHVLAASEGHERVGVQLTYLSLDSSEAREYRRDYTAAELAEFFARLLADYASWAKRLANWRTRRDQAIKAAPFPFEEYRGGQRDLAVRAWKAFERGERLFALAPTGIGKTAAVLYPALKALAHGHAEKAFYFTAKTTGRAMAEQTLAKMRTRGMACRALTITAKEKICLSPGSECNGDSCAYAAGYFDKLRGALEASLAHEAIDRAAVEELAREHQVCPFEFSLEMSLYADCIICDYNYAFDPRVYLRRFFLESNEPWLFLVDEAHNLVDRGREMFSAMLSKRRVLDVRRPLRQPLPAVYKSLGKVNTELLAWRKLCDEDGSGAVVQAELPEALCKALRGFTRSAEQWLAHNRPASFRADLLEMYFESLHVLRIAEMYGDDYVTYAQRQGRDLVLKLFCQDPARLLDAAFERSAAAVVFSATLHPLSFYRELLGGRPDDPQFELGSPFPEEHFGLLVHGGVPTTWRRRGESYDEVARVIEAAVQAAAGNTFVYFPSYRYLESVAPLVQLPQTTLLVQSRGMSEPERDTYLAAFESPGETPVVGMGVMGGVFAEGIDLAGDRLVCAVVVGVGLPQVCLERELLRKFYDERENRGFAYAYMLPGFNRVMQAAGRVIRTGSDCGAVALVDERFARRDYRNIFPPHWRHVRYERNTPGVKRALHRFWQTTQQDD
ncbi:MAG: DEAD/DEAH box helicase [Candidatus Cloacimonetes bacterium]|nr:DEAD/DEAH box helicase [Candidatus Cloacimonadota bacterium]